MIQRDIKVLATKLISRLFPNDITIPENMESFDDSDDIFESSNNSDLTHEERLSRLLEEEGNESTVILPSQGNKKPSNIGEELTIFARDPRNRPPILDKLFGALKTIPPTSIESERIFSTCGLYVTKLRTRMNDDTLHSLVFLNKYYNRYKKEQKEI